MSTNVRVVGFIKCTRRQVIWGQTSNYLALKSFDRTHLNTGRCKYDPKLTRVKQNKSLSKYPQYDIIWLLYCNLRKYLSRELQFSTEGFHLVKSPNLNLSWRLDTRCQCSVIRHLKACSFSWFPAGGSNILPTCSTFCASWLRFLTRCSPNTKRKVQNQSYFHTNGLSKFITQILIQISHKQKINVKGHRLEYISGCPLCFTDFQNLTHLRWDFNILQPV